MGECNLKTRQVQEFKEIEIGKIPVDWDLKSTKEILKQADEIYGEYETEN